MSKMVNKRRRERSSSDASDSTKSKRGKFILDKVSLPPIDIEGEVLVTGAGEVGQLGLGPDVMEKSRPNLLKLEEKIVEVVAGGMHTVFLTKAGTVLTCGCNDEGALGRVTDDQEDAEFTPGEVVLPEKAVQITAGDSHTAALLEDGRVFAWGTFRDSHGNMGMTVDGNKRLPFCIFKETVKKIASGSDHLVFLTNLGEVYTCGCAEQGQLGRTSERASDRNSRRGIERLVEPQPIATKPSLKLHFDNVWASSYGTFCKVANSDNIYVCGLNNYNQLGLEKCQPYYTPTLSTDLSKYSWQIICSGQHHTLALDIDGRVFVLGRKEYGRLGLGENCDDASDLQIVAHLTGKKIINIACGSASSFAVTEDGDLYGWGMGSSGQLGTGEDDDCAIPTLIKNKNLQTRKVFRVSSGGQHTVILAFTSDNNNSDET